MEMIFCRQCGKQLHASAAFCTQCGAAAAGVTAVSAAGYAAETDPAMRFLLPVGRSGWAIASGYLALFSFFLIPAPLALLTGILAMNDIGRNPEKVGKPRAIFGIVVGGLGTLLLMWLFMKK